MYGAEDAECEPMNLGGELRGLAPARAEDRCSEFLARLSRNACAFTGRVKDEKDSSPADPSSELMWNIPPSLGARLWFLTGAELPFPAAPRTAGGANNGADPSRV